ncbi:TIGR01777 family oxidoreductase [Parapedobacter sp. ISTM3]|uniref:TIGR01777 family oxidoreductase n=1 Tax=Parapedobacter sp. ISTM3 TaxID=2800130 RepID=UPI001908BEE0|nr:TIGR01777 family oxidoreductase [Parapedobacter sp. ISTM3]MBK1441487.1 TIGR01777 family oxidoreductase [Parapedobacter sp. ISTM3]
MEKRVLVTGASGLVGRALVAALVRRGYAVNVLSRQKQPSGLPDVRVYEWDISAGEVDARCVDGAQAIIHLAGENIAQPWSNKRKRAILESRTHSIVLLYDLLKKQIGHEIRTVVSASASGYYGDMGDRWISEDIAPANDVLGQTCLEWERAVSKGRHQGIRAVSLRSGVVLSYDGGIYRKLVGFVNAGLGAVPGTGKQWMPWIHIDDAVAMYIFALEHPGIQGVYNMAAPEPATFSAFIRLIAKQQGRPLWLPNIPRGILKAVLGQMSEMLLSSARLSVEKIRNAGFRFTYPEIGGAVKALSGKR